YRIGVGTAIALRYFLASILYEEISSKNTQSQHPSLEPTSRTSSSQKSPTPTPSSGSNPSISMMNGCHCIADSAPNGGLKLRRICTDN
ncbi:hypothetical protein, partial [Nostoc sp.]